MEREQIIDVFIKNISTIIKKYDFYFEYEIQLDLQKVISFQWRCTIELPNKRIVGISFEKNQICVFDSQTGVCKIQIQSNIKCIEKAFYYLKDKDVRLVLFSFQGLEIWDMEKYSLLNINEKFNFSCIENVPLLNKIACADYQGGIRFFNILTEKYEDEIDIFHPEQIIYMKFIDDKRYVVGYVNGLFIVVNNKQTFSIDLKTIIDDRLVCILPNNRIATVYHNNKIAIIDINLGKIVKILEDINVSINQILECENRLIIDYKNNSIKIWDHDLEKCQLICEYSFTLQSQIIYKLPDNTVAIIGLNFISIVDNDKIIRTIKTLYDKTALIVLSNNKIVLF